MKKWLIFSALAGSAAVQAAPQTIRIDAGGVELELVDGPMDAPFELSYRPQGKCQPEVAITHEENVTTARHTKSCHGTGDYEGTIFTLRMSALTSFELELTAGGVSLSGTGLENYRDMRFSTRVGGISGSRPDLPWTKVRKWLVGAEASAQRDSGCCTMAIRVSYGGISVR
ncbi:hypothetical protein ACFFTM_20050 [Pseudoduganella plicata]|uniref:DUF4402 domain-containing protein n=1 Tax=Pseudoduganella plicata TaxID=321984 RepID=A0A4P7BG35_9BURK|nr:hypothetical protein [Pseudoduganella plicata]QBQ37162.1 hypothetical protein E1742_14000 [Pseudoduganella plicata]GGY98840.1 hypothetical protein GCM10007388_35570 [Pseudoduganella plicata]